MTLSCRGNIVEVCDSTVFRTPLLLHVRWRFCFSPCRSFKFINIIVGVDKYIFEEKAQSKVLLSTYLGSPKKTSVGSPVKKRSTGKQQKNRWKVKTKIFKSNVGSKWNLLFKFSVKVKFLNQFSDQVKSLEAILGQVKSLKVIFGPSELLEQLIKSCKLFVSVLIVFICICVGLDCILYFAFRWKVNIHACTSFSISN